MNQLPKRLTPLQEAVVRLKDRKQKLTDKFNYPLTEKTQVAFSGMILTIDECIKMVEVGYESDQQLLSETFDAGEKYGSNNACFGHGKVTRAEWESTPDKKQFLSQFNQEK